MQLHHLFTLYFKKDESMTPDFHSLTPEIIIPLVEENLGLKLTNLCRAFTSYINRVYELQREDGSIIVAKFYRPGRWPR